MSCASIGVTISHRYAAVKFQFAIFICTRYTTQTVRTLFLGVYTRTMREKYGRAKKGARTNEVVYGPKQRWHSILRSMPTRGRFATPKPKKIASAALLGTLRLSSIPNLPVSDRIWSFFDYFGVVLVSGI